MSTNTTQGAGEHPNGRNAMEQLQKRLRDSGYTSRQAEEAARKTAIRMDRKGNGRGNG